MRKETTHLLMRNSLVGCVGLATSLGANAIRVDTRASVTPAVTVTDNVCLSQDNKKWDWIGLATPSAGIKATGRKASIDITGSVQFNTLSDSQLESNDCSSSLGGGDREKFAPKLRANATGVLIDKWLTLAATGRVDQQETNSFRGGGNDDLDRRGNRNNYFRYSISPTLAHSIGRRATGSLRYSYDQKVNSEDSVADTTRQSLNLSINKTGSSAISAGISANASELTTDDRDDGVRGRTSELSSANLNLGYQISQRWQVNGSAGYDFNDYQSSRRGGRDQKGASWDLGLRWAPSPRTSVSLGSGNRYFGKTPRLQINHKRQKNDFELAYKTSITFDREIRDFDQGFLDGNSASSGSFDQSPIVDERLTLSYTYTGRKASVNVRGSYSEQTREEDDSAAVFQNLGVTFSPILSRYYTTAASVIWDSNEPRDPIGFGDTEFSNDTQTWRAVFTLGKQFNDRMNMSVNYTFTDRQSDREAGEYQENRITASLSIKL